jgi:gliding motility-associated-like protein
MVEYVVHRYDVNDVFIDGDFDICENSNDVAKVYVSKSNVAKSLWIDESNGDTLSNSREFEITKHGKYSVSVVDKNGCSGQKQFIINRREMPKVEIAGAETPVCNKRYARLTAISDSKCKYEWSTGDDGAEISATQSGEYSVVATNEYGCKSSTSTELIFNDIPDMSATGDFRICPGENVVVGVTGADEYVWSDGSESDECVFIEACNGYVIGRDRYGCQKRIDFKIEEIPVPTVSIAAVPAKIKRGDSEVSLSLDSGDDLSECTFIWLMSDGGTSSQQSFSHEFNVDDASLFSAVAVVETKDGCKLRLHTTIETEFVIPNTFTPNGDMINDHFMKGYHVEIKDRHGIMLYQGEDGWNGILPNGKVTPDTYYYIVTDATGQKHYGYVTVAM